MGCGKGKEGQNVPSEITSQHLMYLKHTYRSIIGIWGQPAFDTVQCKFGKQKKTPFL